MGYNFSQLGPVTKAHKHLTATEPWQLHCGGMLILTIDPTSQVMTWRMMEKPRKETGRRNIRIATIAWRGMKAGARFTVSLFDWSCRAVWVCVVFLGGFCFVARLLFPYWTFIILDLSQISSSGYKNCHYRCDARSNGKKNCLWRTSYSYWTWFRERLKWTFRLTSLRARSTVTPKKNSVW